MNIEEKKIFLEEQIHDINVNIMKGEYSKPKRKSMERLLISYQRELMKLNTSISIGKPIKPENETVTVYDKKKDKLKGRVSIMKKTHRRIGV